MKPIPRKVRSNVLDSRQLPRRSLPRRRPLAFVCVLLFPLFSIIIFQAAVAFWSYPQGIEHLPAAGTFVEDRDGTPLAALVGPDGQWRVPLGSDEVSPHLLSAIVSVEDGRFYEHRGVDWRSAAGAAWHDLARLRFARGASTLTMQLQRLRDPRPRTPWNKFEQAVRAEQLEQSASKRQILLEYVNRAPFGGNLVGAGAASWRYFGKPCRDLSLGEAALLAGLPQSPNRLRPDHFPQRALARRDHVLDRMLARGLIDAAQRDAAAREPITAAWRPLPQAAAAEGSLPAYVTLADRYPGRVLRSTIEASLQRHAAEAAARHLRELEPCGVSSAVVLVLDTQTSQMLASVSLSRDAHGIDLAHRPRSTGSTVKPFIYAAAFDAGVCDGTTTLLDSPAAWPGYQPANYDRQFRGPIRAADALAESRNIPAMLLLAKVGVERSVGVMQSLGLRGLDRSPRAYGLTLAIGGAEATPLELAEAYATLARGGTARPVVCALAADARELPPAAATSGPRALSADACWSVLAAIADADRTERVSREAARLGVAWKTGTSSGHRDAWCCAVTPRRTLVVWLGNATGSKGAASLIGQEAAAPLALRLIAAIDPGGAPWPRPAAPHRPPRAASAIASAELSASRTRPLLIVSPAAGQEVVRNPDLPLDRQQLSLRAAAPAADAGGAQGHVWWFVDEQPVADGPRQTQAWWSPSAGVHRVRVVDDAGHSDAVQIVVRD